MKIIPLTVALLGATSAISLESQAEAHMKAMAENGITMKEVSSHNPDEDQHLSQLVA